MRAVAGSLGAIFGLGQRDVDSLTSGADVDRRNQTTISSVSSTLRGARAALATNDGRWTLVSTSLTAVIAGSIAWLAVGATPANTEAGRDSLFPYKLFQDLTSRGASYASLGPNAARAISPSAGVQQPANTTPSIDKRMISLSSGDTLAGALTEAGLSQDEAATAINALATSFEPRSLKAGQTFDIELSTPDPSAAPDATDAGIRLLSLHFSPTVEQDITLTRGADGTFAVDNVQKKLESHTHRAGATIDSSLYKSAMQAGIPDKIVAELMSMFAYKVDFQRDIHPGDSFEVYYDYYYTPDGHPARPGNIAFAVMRLGGRDVTLYRYQPDPNQPADYFDATGQSAKGLLMKTPVDGARISSGFGMRFHPVLGYTRMHKGIDFAVPTGTPVMAAGGGTIAFAGVENGYGNFVIINHGNGYSTAYGHLSRFASGIHKGSHVSQGQVVAYSGMTGIATGPHLHYEIRINNTQVNPLKVKFAEGRKLVSNELRNYQIQRLHLDAEMASTKLETRVADISTDLRQAKK